MNDETVLSLTPTPGDDAFLALGRAIAAQCPSGFEEAKLAAELGGGVAGMELSCTPASGVEVGVQIDPLAQTHIQALLEPIREKMAGEGEPLWRKCVVTLRKGGHFQMDVEY